MKRLFAFAILALAATWAHAQAPVINCTVACQFVTDSTQQTPMPTQCKLFNGGALVQLAAVAPVAANATSGAPAGTGCVFNGVKFAEGTSVSLTAKFVVAGVDTDPSVCTTGSYSCPLVFTSSAGSVADVTPPTVPTGLVATANSATQVAVSWGVATDNVGVTGYRVERCTGVGCSAFTQVATPATNVYTDPNVGASTSYSYRVRAVDAAGNVGPYSNTGSVTTPVAAAANVIGETAVLGQPDGNNAGWLLSQNATLTKAAAILSMSVYCSTPGGQVRLGIYDATGPSGGPGVKRAETAAFTPVAGWNTAPTTTSVTLPAGTYWLAFMPNSNTFQTPKGVTTGTSALYLSGVAFGPMPSPFPGPLTPDPVHWSIYATFAAGMPPSNLRFGP